ncbi:ABC transporter ATP-binding protein [Alkalihalobacillus sp. 1P02AB]|uniref:ABC transporter ATP-binding protein n=1 Tax=Alkalihalobacillus sp. 1P02AB TaxID=3132260 RepID=UPI0039A5DF2E
MLVQVQELMKEFKGEKAVKELSFQIKKGKCIALLGPNGAGKTTTLNMLAGLLQPTSGTIRFGSDVADVRELIGFLPQQPHLFGWMTAVEFLKLSGELSAMSKQELQQRIDLVLAFVGLEKVKKKRIAGFSGGMKQRLGLAQAILHEPPLLILDEPVSALDPTGRREVLDLIRKMKKEMTILFSTHILHDAEQVCDEVLMLKDGELRWDGTLTDLRDSLKTSKIKIKTKEPIKGVFEEVSQKVEIEYISDYEVVLTVEPNTNPSLFWQKLLEHQHTILYFNANQATLEEAYMEVLTR